MRRTINSYIKLKNETASPSSYIIKAKKEH